MTAADYWPPVPTTTKMLTTTTTTTTTNTNTNTTTTNTTNHNNTAQQQQQMRDQWEKRVTGALFRKLKREVRAAHDALLRTPSGWVAPDLVWTRFGCPAVGTARLFCRVRRRARVS